MRFAKRNLETNNQPFFLVTGIKRPHLNWRCPEAYVDLYPLESVSVPKQLTLDKSIDPVAWAAFPMNAPLGPNMSSSAIEAGGMSAGWRGSYGQNDGHRQMEDAANGCGQVLRDTGGGQMQKRVAQYPQGLKQPICLSVAICKPGNTIGCTAWIFRS